MSPSWADASAAVVANVRDAHERLIRELYEAARAVCNGQPDGRARFVAVSALARRQTAAEQQWLLPLIDEHGNGAATLRRDHEQIRDGLARAEAELLRDARSDFSDVAQELLVMLRAHCIRQERLFRAAARAIYAAAPAPLLDKLLTLYCL